MKSKKSLTKGILFGTAVALTVSALFTGCNFTGVFPETPDYNADIEIVLPENLPTEDFVAEEDKTYYTSPGLSLWMEVNGAFFEMDYFELDGNKRVYDNLYLYKNDYFYIVTDDLKYLYASLSDPNDSEYAEEEKEIGEDIQINVKKEGIYKLTFDVDTLKFDMEYKAEIQTPVYHTIKKCQIYTKTTEWVDMSVNPDNPEEFVIKNFNIGVNESIFFQDTSHTSLYKTTLDSSCEGKYANNSARQKYPTPKVNVGGNYNVYINAKTYEVRLELLNPETAIYSCVYYDVGTDDFVKLEPYEMDIPYIFRRRLTVEKQYESLPDFYTEGYNTYDLSVVKSDFLMGSGKDYIFKQAGVYDLIINLKTFEISVELLPQ